MVSYLGSLFKAERLATQGVVEGCLQFLSDLDDLAIDVPNAVSNTAHS